MKSLRFPIRFTGAQFSIETVAMNLHLFVQLPTHVTSQSREEIIVVCRGRHYYLEAICDISFWILSTFGRGFHE